jgi:hypothetical protein
MPETSPQRQLLGRYAAATRWGDTETAATTGRDLRALKLEDYVRRVVNDAPPLTPEQIDRIGRVLRGASA